MSSKKTRRAGSAQETGKPVGWAWTHRPPTSREISPPRFSDVEAAVLGFGEGAPTWGPDWAGPGAFLSCPRDTCVPPLCCPPCRGASGPDSSEGTPRQEGRETDAGHVAAPPGLHQLSFFLQELLRTSLVVQRLRL